MNDKNMFSGPHIINYVIIIVFSSIFVSVAPSDQAKLKRYSRLPLNHWRNTLNRNHMVILNELNLFSMKLHIWVIFSFNLLLRHMWKKVYYINGE